MSPELSEMKQVVAELNQHLAQLSAQLRLMTAQQSGGQATASPWLPLREAAQLLRFPSPRSLRNRIMRGAFPPDCYRQVPSPTGKRHAYLVNVERYLRSLR
jgi:hypothetical protein